MVTLLTTERNAGMLDGFVRHFERSLSSGLRELTYGQLIAMTRLPSGAYVFGDCDVMAPEEAAIAREVWDSLRKCGGERVRLFNDPRRQLGRKELLDELHQQGVNTYRAFRATELEASVRFPVFLRLERDHEGPRSDLIRDEAGLYHKLCEFAFAGFDPWELLIVEFADVSDSTGHFRKYAAVRVGDELLAQHVMISREWCTKRSSRILTPEHDLEGDRFVAENPHAGLLWPVFEMAGVEYGRIDYGLREGGIEVWEINDNPSYLSQRPRLRKENIPKHKRLIRALQGLDEGLASGGSFDFELDQARLFEVIRRARERAQKPLGARG
jgi:hypothetical protein